MRTAIAHTRARLAIASVLVFVLAVVPAVVRADQVSGAASVTPATAPAASQAEAIEARAELEAALAQMRAVALRVRDQLRTTRKRGTKQQITCVDEALSRSDVAVRRAREMGADALAAYARGDVDAARAARSRFGEIRGAQRMAAAEGAACVPAVVVVTNPSGMTTVRLDVDRRIALGP